MKREVQGGKEGGLEIRLFGTLEVKVGGNPMPRLRTRKGQWLLALLCLKQGAELSREWIAGTLWPDSDAERAAANLRLSLCDLRRALGIEAHRLQAPTARTLRLDLEGATVDLIAFDRAIARGDLESLEEAVALYRGRLLEECVDPWLDLDREQREQAYLAALEPLVEAALERGDPASAEPYLRRAQKLDPFRESVYQGLMRVLAMRGDVAAAIQVYRDLRILLRNELNVEPSAETVAIYRGLKENRDRSQVRRQPELARRPERNDAGRRAHRLPRPLTEFVGREQEVVRLVSLVRQNRLVTLTGPGGIGKTRLAIEIAQAMMADFPDDICFADLAPIQEARLIESVIATAIGVQIEERQRLNDVAAEVLADQTTLVVLDNCEHVVAACAEAVEQLLTGAPQLHVIATSRQPLDIPGESLWRVQPLPFVSEDAGTDVIAGAEAIELFIQRAQLVRPEFALSESNARPIARICRRLDGIPLALELAAARLKILSVEQVATLLDDYFGLLSSGSRTALERHRTLEATIDWSYALLSDSERLLLQRLSVFPGRFNLDAAYAVCGGPELEGSVLDLIGQLADKSLVAVEEERGEALYRLLESTRVYAMARLGVEANLTTLRDRHAAFFLAYAEQVQPMLSLPQAAEWMDRLELWSDDLRLALAWYADSGTPEGREAGLRLATALWQFWHTRHDMGDASMQARNNTWSQAVAWLEKLLAGDPPVSAATASAQLFLAQLSIRRGMPERARELFVQSLAIYEALGDVVGAVTTIGYLASIHKNYGENAQARELLEHGTELSQKAADPVAIGLILSAMGRLSYHEGDIESARRLLDEALAIQRKLGHPLSDTLTYVGAAALAAGDWRAARAAHEESLAINQELKHTVSVAWSLDNLAEVALAAGEIDRACELYRSSAEIFHSLGHRSGLTDCLVGAAEIAILRQRPEAAARLLAGARALRNRHSRVSRSDQMRFDRLADAVASLLGKDAISRVETTSGRMLFDEALACLLEQLDDQTL